MKKIIILFSVMIFSTTISIAQSGPATEVANKIAQKMKDTLGLSQDQKANVFAINMKLHNQKMHMRQQYQYADSITTNTQTIENSRDSLYQRVLNGKQFYEYKQKKKVLISNN